MPTTVRPDSIDALQQIVRRSRRVLPVGATTKPTLSAASEDVQRIDMRQIAGIVDYEPTEYTITALAGTPVDQLQQTLAQHGQYLPCDPPRIDQGATVGGTIAAGISGPCRLRYGGPRDFVLGVRFVDGLAAVVTGGGKVVKNAAGFDFPKLMVGSCGRLGILTELTLKVLPRPSAYCTLRFACPDLLQAIDAQSRLGRSPVLLDAVDLQPPGQLWVRLGGLPAALRRAADRVVQMVGQPASLLKDDDPAEPAAWQPLRDWSWPGDDAHLVRVAMAPSQIGSLDAALQAHGARRRYSVAGNVAWIAWPPEQPLEPLDRLLTVQQLRGTILRGATTSPWIGTHRSSGFARRIQQALDPDGRFLGWDPTPKLKSKPQPESA